MTVLHETDVDGVRCLWVDTGRPTLAARLAFRFGMVDEPVLESGWLHALEHLALEGRGGGRLEVNGSVGLLETEFVVHGPPDLVAAHLTEVAGWLAQPRFERLDMELGVLRAEAMLRGDAPVQRALGWRYGAGGPGLAAYGDCGLGSADRAGLEARARVAFARANAVLALDGPPPPGLRLALRDGPRVAVPVARPVETRPGHYPEPGGLIVSGVVPRSAAMSIGHDLLRQALADRLRDQEGAAYAPWSTYQPVDGSRAVVLGGSDLADRLRPESVSLGHHVLHGLAHDVAAERLDDLRDLRRQQLADPYQAFGVALRASSRVLSDEPVESIDDLRAELDGLQIDHVREAFAAVRRSVLIGAPAEAKGGPSLPLISMVSAPLRPTGDRFRSIDWPAPETTLTIGSGTVEMAERHEAMRVDLRDVAALLRYPDGTRFLLRRDGFGLNVDPAAWRHGERAVALIDDQVSGDLHLDMPERPVEARYTRSGAGNRARALLHVLVTSPVAATLLVLALATLILTVSVSMGAHVAFGPVAIGCFVTIRSIWKDRSS